MNIRKLAPWNWFKKEEDRDYRLPVRRGGEQTPAYDLFGPVQNLHREIDRLFENVFRGFGLGPFWGDRPQAPAVSGGIFRPTLDLGANEKAYTVTVEIPGVDEKDVELEVVEDTLIIRGEKRQEAEEKDKDFYRVERTYGAFERVLSLPADADQDRIEATFKKGVLKVTIPRKALPESEVKRIEVKRA